MHWFVHTNMAFKENQIPPNPAFNELTVCRNDSAQFNIIFRTPLHWLTQNMNCSLDSQKTLHISPSRVSYGVSFVRNLHEIDRVITAPYCI